MISKSVQFFTTIVLVVAIAPVHCAVIYVTTTGSDSNEGSTWRSAKRTIQSGINAAQSGDEVWVAAGTYPECITLKDGVGLYGGFVGREKHRNLRNWETNATVLDGRWKGSVVTIAENAGSGTVVDGFTICNGKGTAHRWHDGDYSEDHFCGGGIYSRGGSPVISHNIIRQNTTVDRPYPEGSWYPVGFGGGIYCAGGSPVIANNIISENDTGRAESMPGDSGWGGGIFCQNASVTISGNTITGNHAFDGGGVYCTGGTAVISGNTITSNSAWNICSTGAGGSGGGVFAWNTTVMISDNYISRNVCAGTGAGIACTSGIVSNNVIAENEAYAEHFRGDTISSGGGIFCWGPVNVERNIIRGNRGKLYGGGIYATEAAVVAGNIVANNTAGHGGGIAALGYYSLSPTIVNNTIVGNNTKLTDYGGHPFGGCGGGIYCEWKKTAPAIVGNIVVFGSSGIGTLDTRIPLLQSNCVYGNNHYDYSWGTTGTDGISTDPLFRDPANGDYHLRLNSPCINAGWNDPLGLPELDMDGQGRIKWGVVDIGADEYWPVQVKIDIKPREFPNYVNPRSKGRLAVAIVSTSDFDSADIDVSTVLLSGVKPIRWGLEDADRDGDADLLLHFDVQALNLTTETAELQLVGRTREGDYIEGSDSVVLVVGENLKP